MTDNSISFNLYFARKIFFRLLPLFLLSGCIPYRIPTENLQLPPEETLSHPLYRVIPRHRCQIYWYDLPHWTAWMLLGNDDDGIFGEGASANFRIDEPPSICKSIRWYFRNPMHNFFFYTIGSAHRCNSELIFVSVSRNRQELLTYRPRAASVFADRDSSLLLALHGGKPFVSLRLAYHPRRSFDFYLGWRERGNFGLKFLPFAKRDQSPLACCDLTRYAEGKKEGVVDEGQTEKIRHCGSRRRSGGICRCD